MEAVSPKNHYAGLPSFEDRQASMKYSQLSLLLLSDIHLAHDKLKLLTLWHFENNLKRFDYVLIPGDFGNIKMETGPSEAELALE